MKMSLTQPQEWATRLASGDIRTLSRLITLAESQIETEFDFCHTVLSLLGTPSGHSIRLGVTGAPGAGKSTLIESLGIEAIDQGFKVAVLAIDPSSPIAGGSLLGDKTRMEKLSQNQKAFIRPSPSKGVLGGVGVRTHDAILLCEAAGFDFIIVETVGVGQSEVSVRQLVDQFLMVALPLAGDDVQGIKKGIVEIADRIFVNKADVFPSESQVTVRHYQNALAMRSSNNESVEVCSGSALNKESVLTLLANVLDDDRQSRSSGAKARARSQYQLELFKQALVYEFSRELSRSEAIKGVGLVGLMTGWPAAVPLSKRAQQCIQKLLIQDENCQT